MFRIFHNFQKHKKVVFERVLNRMTNSEEGDQDKPLNMLPVLEAIR